MRPFGDVINESNDAYVEFWMPNDRPIEVTCDLNSCWICCGDGFGVVDDEPLLVALDVNVFGILYVFKNGVACVVYLEYGALRCPIVDVVNDGYVENR